MSAPVPASALPSHRDGCPPSICTGVLVDPNTIDLVDSLVLEYWKESATSAILSSCFINHMKLFEAELNDVIDASQNGTNIKAEERFLELFRSKLCSRKTPEQADYTEMSLMLAFADRVAKSEWPTEGKEMDLLKRYKIVDFCSLSQNFQQFRERVTSQQTYKFQISTAATNMYNLLSGVTPHFPLKVLDQPAMEKGKIVTLLAMGMLNMVEDYMESGTSIETVFIRNAANFGGKRLLNWANLMMICTRELKPPYNAPQNFIPVSNLVKEMKKGVTDESMELLKLKGDKLATAKKYAAAIEAYQIAGELSKNINARVNCAALRLRIAKDDDRVQFHLVVYDCTCALELDPNHVKALFRRGLALCKLKMWNEGIIDFRRAVELDPRSPAVQELAIALKNV